MSPGVASSARVPQRLLFAGSLLLPSLRPSAAVTTAVLEHRGLKVATAAGVTPIAKVLELLANLQTQIEEEGKEEATQYDHFACFCKEQADEKLYRIEKSTKKIDKFTGKINDLNSEITEVTTKISTLSSVISDLESRISTEEKSRATEREAYLAAEEDVSDALASAEAAIEALKGSKEDIEADLLQLHERSRRVFAASGSGSHIEPAQEQLRKLLAYTQTGQAPPAHKFQGGGIIRLLDKLRTTFVDRKKSLDMDELVAKIADEKNLNSLQLEKRAAEKDKMEKDQRLGELSEEKEGIVSESDQEKADKAADQQFLDKVTEECQNKAELWDQRSQSRVAELKAIADALVALKEGAAPNYKANKKLSGVQLAAKGGTALSFLQARRSADESTAGARLLVRRVAQKLRTAGERLASDALTVAAAKAGALEDHFVKVRGLIKDIIAKLEGDAAEEEEQKSFCDREMGKSILTRDEQQASVEKFTERQATKEAAVALVTEEIANLSEGLAALAKALNEASILRNKEQEENQRTIREAQAGVSAVGQAMSVLKEYYSGESFLQTRVRGRYTAPGADRDGATFSDLAPDSFGSEYAGDQAASKGIIGLLEVVSADFQRTVDTVSTEEGLAAGTFAKFKGDTEKDIHEKGESKSDKETQTTNLQDDIVEAKDNLKEAKENHGQALRTLRDLEESCVKAEETYEERVAKRKQEIESLKGAMEALDEFR